MTPFQNTIAVALNAGIANDGAFVTVPTGQRAVIEHVSVYATGDGAPAADYFITSMIGGDSGSCEVPIVTLQTGTGFVRGSQPIRAFADPGTQFGAIVRRISGTGDVRANFVLAGYYVAV